MLLSLFYLQFVAFPDRRDSILTKMGNINDLNIEASGSLGLFINNKCVMTHTNSTVIEDKKLDWCSNVGKNGESKPWITYSVKGKAMKLTGYSVRNGCCYYACCCLDDGKVYDGADYCCMLFSFSLQGSNDNKTWTILHKAEKVEKFYPCVYKTFEFDTKTSYKYVRFVQEKEYPGCLYCMQVNQIDFYGELVNSAGYFGDEEENDESVSIIGKIRNNE